MHLKRQEVPKRWPVYRKGTKYVVRPDMNLESGVPLIIILRDMLKIVRNRKEARGAIFMKHILVNSRVPKDEKNPVLLFDTISLLPLQKNYRLDLSEGGKFILSEISAEDANKKPVKVVNKKVLRGKKVQINLQDGNNFLSDIKCNTNDSVLIDFKKKKIEKCLPLKESSRAMVFAGKHSGKRGEIKKIDSQKKIVELETHGKEKINVLLKQIMVIE
ncbi:MAG: 30S ribosomal protein S4e [Nanoarchaeota archaeon]